VGKKLLKTRQSEVLGLICVLENRTFNYRLNAIFFGNYSK